jgi:hypothetical protein
VPRLYSREAALPLAAQTEDAFRDPWKGGARAEVARKKTSSPLCSTLVVARTASRLSVARKSQKYYTLPLAHQTKARWRFGGGAFSIARSLTSSSVLFSFSLCFSVRSTPLLSPVRVCRSLPCRRHAPAGGGTVVDGTEGSCVSRRN